MSINVNSVFKFLLKRNRCIENVSFVIEAKKFSVLCKLNKLHAVGNVMSLAKMLFSRYLNNMPFIGSLMSRIKKI